MTDVFYNLYISNTESRVFLDPKGLLSIVINDKKDLDRIKENLELELKKIIKESEESYDEEQMTIAQDIIKRFKLGGRLIENEVILNKIPEDFDELLKKLPEDTIFTLSELNNEEILNMLKKHNFSKESRFNYKHNQYDAFSKEEIIDTIEYIKTIKEYIERYNLSPLETIMLAWDLVRERIYKKNTSNTLEKSTSRDLSRIMKMDEIVCSGYANTLNAILNELGINTELINYNSIKEKNSGHASIICYVNDQKYNVHQILEFDATWASKKTKEDTSYLNDYRRFGLPLKEAYEDKLRENQQPEDLEQLGSQITINQIIKSYKRYQILKGNSIYLFENKELKILFKRIKEHLEKVGNYDLLKECLELQQQFLPKESLTEEEFEEIEALLFEIGILDGELINQPLPLEIFIETLYQVRRIEHSIDKEKYPLSLDIIKTIVNIRENFEKDLKIKMKDDEFFDMLFGHKTPKNISEEEILTTLKKSLENISQDDKLNVDIKRMELIAVFHKILKTERDNPVLPENNKKRR